MPKIWDQNCLLWVFYEWNLKKILSYLKSASSNLSNYKNLGKNENTYLDPKISYLGIFGLQFENEIAIFEINILKFV